MAINPNSRPPQQNSQLRQLLLVLLMRDMMERQQQQQQQQGRQEGDGKKKNQVADAIRKARQVKTAYETMRDLFGYNTAGTASLGSPTTSIPAGASIPEGFSGVGTSIDGGTMIAPNSSLNQSSASTGAPSGTANTSGSAEGTGWGEYAPYLNAAIGAYNAYRTYNNKNLDSDQRNLALAGTAAQTAAPFMAGGWAPALAGAAGALNAGAALAGKGTEEEKTQAAAHQAGMAVANYWTAGLAGLADGYARNQWGGTMKKVDKFMWNNPLGAMYGINLATRPFDTDAWKKEGGRIKQLVESGANIPEQFRGRMYQKRGLRKSELINPNYDINFQGMTADGYVNNKFENSRNEADMTYETLAPYAAWAEKRNDWWNLSDAQRRAVTDAAQKAGAVREHHGTLDVDWTKVGDVDQIISSVQPEQPQQPVFRRPGKGQVARVSPGMYMNDTGRVVRSTTSDGAMKSSYQIPGRRRK